MNGRHAFAALMLMISSACALAATTPDPIPPLLSGDYAEVERLMQAVQSDYKRDAITDEELLVAFRPFYKIDGSQVYHLDRWVERYPKSYVARVARAVYYKTLGFHRPRYNKEDTKRAALKSAHTIAARDLYASLELDDKPLLSYFHAMDLADYVGRRPTRLLLNAANAIDPDNFIARHEFLLSLSSVEEKRAFVADSRAVLPPDEIRRLESAVMVAEAGRALRRHNDPAEAERLYRKVLEFDPQEYTAGLYLLYALANQQKCSEAITLATELLNKPDSRADEIFARRGWCNFRENKIAEGVADWQRAAELGNVWAQKELSGLYWFGKQVARDVDRARQWMQAAAEQGDAEAQQEMQRSFHVTIDTPVPETTSRWGMVALVAVGILAVIVFFVWLEQMDRAAAAANDHLMRYPHNHLVVGVVAAVGFGYFAWLRFWNSYLPWREDGFVVPALFVTIALGLAIAWLTIRHELLADGALFRRFGGRKVPMKWATLRSIRYVGAMKWFRLESQSGVVVRISETMTSMQPFARAVLAQADGAIADLNTRGALEILSQDYSLSDDGDD